MIKNVFKDSNLIENHFFPVPCSLFPVPCSLLPAPCSLLPVPNHPASLVPF
ncbi:MAG: hypothetical protein F6K55_32290 [Moorea sp. SIO4A3]|nr:hypothetical protein [Moorena sp. SIO4A3]